MSEHEQQDTAEPDVPQAEDNAPDTSVEEQARALGWRPKEEWKGKPDTWVDASEYVERGPYSAQLRKSQEEVAKLREQFGRLERTTVAVMKQREEDIRSEYEAKRERAVETGDTEAYKAANAAEKKALAGLDAEKTEPAKNEPPPEVKAWTERNKWFTEHPDMGQAAAGFYALTMRKMPGATEERKLAEVDRRMREEFPDFFGEDEPAPRSSASRVEGGSRTAGGNGSGGSLYSRLPAEAKTMADTLIDQGMFGKIASDKDKAAARERYAKTYSEMA